MRKVKRPCPHGNMEFEFIERIDHVLTNAEESMLGNMEEMTNFVNEEDERLSKEELAEYKVYLASIPEHPRFRITKLDEAVWQEGTVC